MYGKTVIYNKDVIHAVLTLSIVT